MPTLHLFNPSHDEALAAGSPYYYPSMAARTLQADLAALPAWWAERGDYVLLPDGGESFFDEHSLPTEVHFVRGSELRRLPAGTIDTISPWGWDALAQHRLRRLGVEDRLLPTEETIQTIRRLSSRQTAVCVLKRLRSALPQCVGASSWCTTEQEVNEFLGIWGDIMLKSPWSCSGRGVFRATSPMNASTLGRVRRILREQGGIEVEPYYHRVADFAMEFFCKGGKIRYEGFSLFQASETGNYSGNLMAADSTLIQRLPPEVSAEMENVKQALVCVLEEELQGYEGPLGVDMMAVKIDEKTKIHPCVEVNLRNTMGRVACLLRKYFSTPEVGFFSLQSASEVLEESSFVLTKGAGLRAVIRPCPSSGFSTTLSFSQDHE